MFVWDFVAASVLSEIIDWFYGELLGLLGDFFMQMGGMGAELFEMSFVKAIVLFFSYLAWSLYVTGLVVSVFELGIETQSGRGSIKDTAINAIKGFMAVGLFSTVPVELYKLCVSLQGEFTRGITGIGGGCETIAGGIIETLKSAGSLEEGLSASVFGGLHLITSPILLLFIVILIGYAVIKVFFANLKRGGILLIQIAVGSLYMFSVPRGYIDGFVSWSKQVIGLCLTAFCNLQSLLQDCLS